MVGIGFNYLNNGINGTSLLTKSTINAFCHVNVIPRRSPTAIRSFLCFDGDSLNCQYIKRSKLKHFTPALVSLIPVQDKLLHIIYKRCIVLPRMGTSVMHALLEILDLGDLFQRGS